jgi:hypothetical protein
MSDKNKSLGERIGGAVDKAKDVAQDAFASANEKRKEAGERSSANAHDAQAETSDNPIDGAKHSVAGMVDRAKAEGHDSKAEFHEERAKERAERD